MARHLVDLWERNCTGADDGFLLILERPVAKEPTADGIATALSTMKTVAAAVCGHEKAASCLSKTKVLVLPNPHERARESIERVKACSTLEAGTLYSTVLRRAGDLSDENGLRGTGTFLGLSTSDVEAEFNSVAPVLTSVKIDEALSLGICEPIDFTTPKLDPLFYTGVDAQPGHVAAGLILERPALRSAVVQALEQRGNALLRGPSGAGKSALLWDVAHSVRHVVRWFRVRRLGVEDVPLLVRLARGCYASQASPVGFVLDDVGRGLSEGWSAIAKEADAQVGIVLLSSVREEDVYPLMERARTVEVSLLGDEDIARYMWEQLRERGQTGWSGWREPWAASKGLLLEYAHILTQGTRLGATLNEQVGIRAKNPAREVELDVLRVCSAAMSTGARVLASALPSVLGRSSSEVAVALPRLVDEHLLRDIGDGYLAGLHELRSQELYRLTLPTSLKTPADILSAAVNIVPDADLGVLLARCLDNQPTAEAPVLDATAERLHRSHSLEAAAAALDGLAQTQVGRTVDHWLASAEVQAIPGSQLRTAVLFGASGVEVPDLLRENRPLAAAIDRLTSLKDASATSNLRQELLARLTGPDLAGLLSKADRISSLVALLRALVGQAIPAELVAELTSLEPDLLGAPLDQVEAVLGAARLVNAGIAEAWVANVGQEELLARVEREVPWSTKPELRAAADGLVVAANICVATGAYQPDVHGAVVSLCELLLALAPSAELVESDAVSPDGCLHGFGDFHTASKRIPRGNLPPAPLPNWNKRWSAAIDAKLAPANYTSYLETSKALLGRLTPALTRLLDELFRGKTPKESLAVLGEVHDAARHMVAPQLPLLESVTTEPRQKGQTSRLQQVLFDCSGDLLRRFIQLPDQASLFISRTGTLVESLSAAISEEPWDLTAEEPGAPTALALLKELVSGMRSMAGESSKTGLKPVHVYRRKHAKAGSAVRDALDSVGRATSRRIAEFEATLRRSAATEWPEVEVFARESSNGLPVWPPVEVLLVVSVGSVAEWLPLLTQLWPKWRALVGPYHKVVVIPVVAGVAVCGTAVSGLDTPSPDRAGAENWVLSIGLRLAPTPLSDAWTELAVALLDVASIEGQEFGVPGRPIAEQRARTDARARLTKARQDFDVQEPPDEPCAFASALEQLVETEPLTFVLSQCSVLRGALDELTEALVAMRVACLTADVQRAIPAA